METVIYIGAFGQFKCGQCGNIELVIQECPDNEFLEITCKKCNAHTYLELLDGRFRLLPK